MAGPAAAAHYHHHMLNEHGPWVCGTPALWGRGGGQLRQKLLPAPEPASAPGVPPFRPPTPADTLRACSLQSHSQTSPAPRQQTPAPVTPKHQSSGLQRGPTWLLADGGPDPTAAGTLAVESAPGRGRGRGAQAQPVLEDPSLVHPKLLCRLEMPPWTLSPLWRPDDQEVPRAPVGLPCSPGPRWPRTPQQSPRPSRPVRCSLRLPKL